jgi:hypothetical protein
VGDQTGLPPGAVRWVLSRDPQGEVAPPALVTTRLAHARAQMWEWCVRRWTRAVTCEAARAPLGIEPPRQWKDWALGRTPPALFGRYSLVPLLAPAVPQAAARSVRTAAWSAKGRPPFSEALAVVSRELWSSCHLPMSESDAEMIQIPRSVWERLTATVCYAIVRTKSRQR